LGSDARVTEHTSSSDIRSKAIVSRVHGIVVTYHPEPEKLSVLIDAVDQQVERIVIVDNGSTEMRNWLRETAVRRGCDLRELDHNVGVAAAHNVGIATARAGGADAVLLLDQDSLPAPDMVAALRLALGELVAAGERIAAVGPCHIDQRTKTQSPFIRFGFLANDHLYCASTRPESTIRCDHLITSGSLIPIAALDDIGELEEDLFIDNVDTEWCFRALAKGYHLFGVCSAQMSHGVGETLLDTWLPFSRAVVVHAPLRLYYITRNHMLLYQRSYAPSTWILQDVPRLAFKSVLFATSVKPRSRNLSMIVKGLWDGVRGKTGPYQSR